MGSFSLLFRVIETPLQGAGRLRFLVGFPCGLPVCTPLSVFVWVSLQNQEGQGPFAPWHWRFRNGC